MRNNFPPRTEPSSPKESSNMSYANSYIINMPDGNKRITYSYTVKSISNDLIILTGERGDMNLPNDVSVVQLFNGPEKDFPKLELSVLKTGDTVNLEFKPGKSAYLFLLKK